MLSKKPSAMLFLVGLIAFPCSTTASAEPALTPLPTIAAAFTNQQSNLQVLQEGAITRVLSDDTTGDRHQRIIIRLGNDQTLLIAHNIDLAPRVPSPAVGKMLRFYGEYEWNDEGGVVHWTHTDPNSQHVGGWLEYEGKKYGSNESTHVSKFTNAPKITNRIPTGSIRFKGNSLSNTDRFLFDIRGRLVGHPAVRTTPGIYLIRSSDNWQGSIKFLHD